MAAADGTTDAPTGAPGTTIRREQAASTITKTTITPSPGSEVEETDDEGSGRRRFRRTPRIHGQLGAALAPHPGANIVRVVMSMLLSALCLLTVGGAILLLLLWQQQRASGVLSSQLERTWNLFDTLREVERWVAFAVLPVAAVWIALAAINVRRATGRRRDPVFAVASLVFGVLGAWFIGARIVAEADDWIGQAAGFVLQAIFLAIPLLALERIAGVAEARHGPLRATYVISVVFLAHLEFLGALSTTDQTAGPDDWGRLGAYLVICALLQVLGALSANEAARAIEDGTEHRYNLRNRFGEALLAQAERG